MRADSVRHHGEAELMNIFCIVALSFSGVLAAVCGVAIPFWLMGVPGVENAYAKGWRIGLLVLVLYPTAWVGLLVFWRLASKTIPAESLSRWQLSVGSGSLVLLAMAAGVMTRAFKVMSRS
jgi:hypothetical protein